MINKKLILMVIILALIFSGCAKKEESGETTSNNEPVVASGLTSMEASKLAYKEANKALGDVFIYRAIPTNSEKSTTLFLDKNWFENDISNAWFFWFAETDGTLWMLVKIEGNKITDTTVGTRDITPANYPATFPSTSFIVSMKQAADIVKAQGADLTKLTWIEYTAKNPTFETQWKLSFSEDIGSSTVHYIIYVDGITGSIIKSTTAEGFNFPLPIDRVALQKPREEDHREAIVKFFEYVNNKDYGHVSLQLSFDMCPNDTMSEMWLENFKSIKSVEVKSIEVNRLPEWTDEIEYYKVVLDIKTDASPEQFGWDNGLNTRWISIIPEGAGYWNIKEIATNP